MKKKIIIGVVVTIVLIVIVACFLLITLNPVKVEEIGQSSHFPTCDDPKHPSVLGVYSSSAVTTDAAPCAKVAMDILKRNGTAADAAIASMFCVGVFNAQSCGLGGGFVATYYSREEGMAFTLDAREAAPMAAYPQMYDQEYNENLKGTKENWYEKKGAPNVKGGLSVAVPGEADGLYALYTKFGGGLPWEDLLEPAINLCENGYQLSWYTGGLNYLLRNDLLQEPSMSMFVNKKEKRALGDGDTVYRKQLANTLRTLQKDHEALKRGPLAKAMIADLNTFGGIITEEDLEVYKPKWRDPVTFNLQNGGFKIHSFPPPGSGLVLGLILNILDEFNLTKSSLESNELFRTHQKVVEAFKFSYAQRYRLGDLSQDDIQKVTEDITSDVLASEIKQKIDLLINKTNQDPTFYGTEIVPPEDQGTAHISLIAPNGDAVSITSSINMAYGAGVRSESTGVIFNNHMSDFTTDLRASKPGAMNMSKNMIIPGHRPLSSMSPTIIVNETNDVVLVLGAAGGIQIPSVSAWVAGRILWMGQTLKESVDACRSHHSLIPMKYRHEAGFPKPIIDAMKEKGHVVEALRWKSVVSSVARNFHGDIEANADFRKSGAIDGF